MLFQTGVRVAHDLIRISAGLENQDGMHAIGSYYGGLAHSRLPIEHALHVLGKNVESLRRDDHLLLSAAHGEAAFSIDGTDIASTEPAVLERAVADCVEIAGSHVLAAYQDF